MQASPSAQFGSYPGSGIGVAGITVPMQDSCHPIRAFLERRGREWSCLARRIFFHSYYTATLVVLIDSYMLFLVLHLVVLFAIQAHDTANWGGVLSTYICTWFLHSFCRFKQSFLVPFHECGGRGAFSAPVLWPAGIRLHFSQELSIALRERAARCD